MDPQVLVDLQVIEVSRVLLERQDLLDPQVLVVLLVRGVFRVILDTPALLVLLDSGDPLEREVSVAIPDLLVPMVLLEATVLEALPERRVFKEMRVLRVLRDSEVLRDPRVFRVLLDTLDLSDLLELGVFRERGVLV